MWFWILLGLGGAFVAGVALARESERRRLIAPPEVPPMRLLTSMAAHVTSVDVGPQSAHSKSLCQIGITPVQEAFTPPLPQGMLKLVFSGTCAMKEDFHNTPRPWFGVDACYWTDANQNYLKRHRSLVLDGTEFRADPVESDRAAHRYTFEYQWRGGRLGVLLKPPMSFPDHKATKGLIELAVLWTSPLEGSIEAEERKRDKERIRKALEWATTAHLDSNFLDQQYRENYAAKHTAKILNTFRDQWRREYLELIADEPLFTLVQAEHPHVVEFFEARFEVIRIAQRLAAEPDPQPPAPEPPSPKKTPDERRDADLSWFKVLTQDYRQRALLRLTEEQDFLNELSRQFPNLSNHELQRELQRFRDEALNSADKGTTGLPGMKTF